MKRILSIRCLFVFFAFVLLSGCASLQESLRMQTEREYISPIKEDFSEASSYVDSDPMKAAGYFEKSISKANEFLESTNESARKRESLQPEIQEANSYVVKAYFGIGRWCYYAAAIDSKKEIPLSERLKLFEQAIEQMDNAAKYHVEGELSENILETEENAKNEIKAIREFINFRGIYKEKSKNINEIIRKAGTDKSLGEAYMREFSEIADKLKSLRTHEYLEDDIVKLRNDLGLLEKSLIEEKAISGEVSSAEHYKKGMSSYSAGEYINAMEEFKLIGENSPSYKEVSGKIKEIEQNSKDSRGHYIKGSQYYSENNFEEAKRELKLLDQRYLSSKDIKDIREKLENIQGGGDLGAFTHDGIKGTQKTREGSMEIGEVREYSLIIESVGDLEICVSPGYRVEGEEFKFPPNPNDPKSGIATFRSDPTRYKRFVREKIESGTAITVKIIRDRGPDNYKFIFKLYPR